MSCSHYTKRRKEIWQALHPATTGQRFESVFDAIGEQVGQVAPPVAKHGRPQEQGFAAATAAVTGEEKRTINRHIARAEAIGDDLPRVTGTSVAWALGVAVTGAIAVGLFAIYPVALVLRTVWRWA